MKNDPLAFIVGVGLATFVVLAYFAVWNLWHNKKIK